ncbi:DUF4190 domain-containing protein [Actinotalea sp. K2]|uniref:DUF4190 domain-containing protein n=1 Tax=Actinotalea sp. K2 TaxID=2939438 RepID=UPI002017BE0F|nr:DUF4190 domain-containing protein [Actinotalea sp. K2]MCL3863180.1 DUF4190 domain-containing protein [Actinotalea sp. K2]
MSTTPGWPAPDPAGSLQPSGTPPSGSWQPAAGPGPVPPPPPPPPIVAPGYATGQPYGAVPQPYGGYSATSDPYDVDPYRGSSTTPGPYNVDPYRGSSATPFGGHGAPPQPYVEYAAPPTGYGAPPSTGYGALPAAGYGVPPSASYGAAPQPYGGYGPPPQWAPPAMNEPMAVAALVCGIASLFISITGPVGVVLGAVALRRIARTGNQGRGMAIAGIVTGVLGTLSLLLLALLLAVGFSEGFQDGYSSTATALPTTSSSSILQSFAAPVALHR